MFKNVILSFSDAVSVRVYEYGIKNSEGENLIGVKFDNELIFEKHITGICGKASRKIYALERIAPQMDLSKRRMVTNVFFFFNLHFNYCLPIWMCHNCTTNLKISMLHERCFAYNI